MRRLYNENSVPNKDGQKFSVGVRIIARDLVKIARDNDLDLRDAQLMTSHEIDALFSEAILIRAAKKRKKDREDKEWT
jgi:hypothetical protein